MVNMFFSVFRQTQKHVFSLIQLERQGLLILDGKHVFQCFSSDPKTRVFECFWASLSILDGKNVFQCFWSDPKTRVFESFSEVLYCFCHRLGSLYTRFTQTLQER